MGESEAVLTGEPSRLESEAQFTRRPDALLEPRSLDETAQRSRLVSKLATAAVLLFALAALIPTVGDFGLTWDEPAYRYSQVMSSQWWEQLSQIRTAADAEEVFDPTTLLYLWHYGRFG